jgi:hypothetical protein
MVQTNGIFVPTPPVALDGRSHSVEIPLPDHAPRPTPITAAYVVLHTGKTAIMEIGGFFTLWVGRERGPLLLVSAMNRHGAARWTHDPPVLVQPREKIMLTYGGQIGAARDLDRFLRRFLRYRFEASIQPDVALFWTE